MRLLASLHVWHHSVVGGLVDEASAPRISVGDLPTALEEEQVRLGRDLVNIDGHMLVPHSWVRLQGVGGTLVCVYRVCITSVLSGLVVRPVCHTSSAQSMAAVGAGAAVTCPAAVLLLLWLRAFWRVFLLLCVCCRLQVRSILGTFGVLKAFTMLRDAAGKPSGTVLAEFADPGVINAAVAGATLRAPLTP
jgi:hypothetical protein